jgi:hypothetical protein
VVGVLVVAAVALGALGQGSQMTLSEFDWAAPISQFVAR